MGLKNLYYQIMATKKQVLYYETALNMQECISRIIEEPQKYKDKNWTELWYEAVKISNTQVLITFKGGQFRKAVRTQYIMEFLSQENNTLISLRFQNELFGCPPMTLPNDIDLCMMQKLDATPKRGGILQE